MGGHGQGRGPLLTGRVHLPCSLFGPVPLLPEHGQAAGCGPPGWWESFHHVRCGARGLELGRGKVIRPRTCSEESGVGGELLEHSLVLAPSPAQLLGTLPGQRVQVSRETGRGRGKPPPQMPRGLPSSTPCRGRGLPPSVEPGGALTGSGWGRAAWTGVGPLPSPLWAPASPPRAERGTEGGDDGITFPRGHSRPGAHRPSLSQEQSGESDQCATRLTLTCLLSPMTQH